VGKYHSIQEADVRLVLKKPPRISRGTVLEHVVDLYGGACGNCTSSTERQVLAQLLTEYSDIFSHGNGDMGLAKVIFHEIPLAAGTSLIRQPTQRLGPEKKVSWQVQELLDRFLIETGRGAWSSPVILVKKNDGSWRFCADYHRLNSVTIQDAYPLRQINESLNALGGSKYFSTLNLLSGYWQVPFSPDAQDKAAFIIRDRF